MGVDPRFDPVFQRGYDPTKHRGRRTHPRVEERREAPRLETPVEVAEPPVDSTGSTTEAVTRPNPFRLALLLASLAAIGGASALLWHRLSTDPYYYYSSPSDREALFADIFVQAAIPALLTAGVVGLAVWLALGGLRRHDGV